MTARPTCCTNHKLKFDREEVSLKAHLRQLHNAVRNSPRYTALLDRAERAKQYRNEAAAGCAAERSAAA